MATSSKSTSIRKAQVPVSCYFCKGQDIKWKCEDCNIRMCNSCKVTVHQGLQSIQDHDVVSIQDISKLSTDSQDITSVVISSVCNSYTTTLPAIHTLLSVDNDLLYFTYNGPTSDKRLLVNGKLLKSTIKILQTLKRSIFDIAINKDGEILFIEHHDHKIQVLSYTGEVKTVLDSFPMTLLGIHVNKDNEVIVGLREPGPPFPVHDFSIRQVIIFGSDYQRRKTIELDKKGNKLFNYANRICTDSKNNIYVVDSIDNEGNGRIVAVDRNARLKFTYDGQKELGGFQPNGIIITPSNNIVVAEREYDALHVINSKGELLGLQFIFKDLGIYDPLSLCFDTGGCLLIGCGKSKKVDYGQIYVVKLVDRLM